MPGNHWVLLQGTSPRRYTHRHGSGHLSCSSMRVAVVTSSFNMPGCSSRPVQLVTHVWHPPQVLYVSHIKTARGKPHGSLEASMVTLGSKSCHKPHKAYRQFSAETAGTKTPSHKIKSKSKIWKPWSLVELVSTTSKSVMTSLFNSFMTTAAKPQLFSTQYLKTITFKADYLLSFREM